MLRYQSAEVGGPELGSDPAQQLLLVEVVAVDRGVDAEGLFTVVEAAFGLFVLRLGDDRLVQQEDVVHLEKDLPRLRQIPSRQLQGQLLLQQFELLLLQLLALVEKV